MPEPSKARISIAGFIIRLGRLIQSSAIMVMRPVDLIEFGRLTYCSNESCREWEDSDLNSSGLDPLEHELMLNVSAADGDEILCLGVGGGREAISFAEVGLTVTGLDYVPRLVEFATQNARQKGYEIKGIVQEMSAMSFPAETFDYVWISNVMYSSIPSRKRRLATLKKIQKVLKPGGLIVCMFKWNPRQKPSLYARLLFKSLALLTNGFKEWDVGDRLHLNKEFLHEFQSEKEFSEEVDGAGLKVQYLKINPGEFRGGAILSAL